MPKMWPHWNYFLAIERELDVLSRYVEFDERNFACFSIEIARVLLAAGSEVDVICKQICRQINPASTARKINVYADEMASAYPEIPNFEVTVPRYGLSLRPWEKWNTKGGVPLWWTAYNKVKHHRHSDYHVANLKNALEAVSGLFVVVLYLYKEDAEEGFLLSTPQLLAAGRDHIKASATLIRPIYRL